MPKKSSGVAPPRIPQPVDGIQVNFCRNTGCTNFGTADAPHERPRKGRPRRGANLRGDHRYTVASEGRKLPVIRCLACGQSTRVKSNLAIAEELARIGAYLQPDDGPGCPDATSTASVSGSPRRANGN